ncbi:MAG: hypothetical protein R3C11_21610 [Planctomycetaceae bacterium]
MTSFNRRDFLKNSIALSAGFTLLGANARNLFAAQAAPLYKISLAGWSLHTAFQKGERDHLDFASIARNEFGIEAVEYVNQFFKDQAKDMNYLGELKSRAANEGVKSLLIMIDGEGAFADPDEAKRTSD